MSISTTRRTQTKTTENGASGGTSFLLSLFIILATAALSPELAAQEQGEQPLFRRLDQAESGIDFANIVEEDERFNINQFIYAYNGGGIAVGDVDHDGLLDLYFSGTQAHTPNRLYLNKGNMRFEDVSKASGTDDTTGVRYGVTMVDINSDGWIDIYVNKQHDPNTLYVNNRNGTFTERAKEYGLDFCCSSTHTAFLDYDRDGDLDAYIGINGTATGDDYTNKGKNDQLLRNNGDGTFTNVTDGSGIVDEGYALSVSVGDVDNDGWPDIYITNDFVWHDILYINNRDGTFTEATKTVMKHTTEFGMGSDIADFNGDGLLDIFAVDMLPEDHWRKMSHMGSQNAFSPLFDSTQMMRNTLQLNRGNGTFSEIAQLSGVDETDWSWAPLFADYDLDGNVDLFITNGYKRDVANRDVIEYITRSTPISMLKLVPSIKLKNYAYRNNGDLTFTKVSDEWGIGQYVNSNGGIYADLDNDGDLDLIINNIDTLSTIYRNEASDRKKGNWLKVHLVGTGKNPAGVGARVQIVSDGEVQIREFTPVRGYLSSSYDDLHFGLGSLDEVERLLVTWPDGSSQTIEDVDVNQVLTLMQKNAKKETDIAALRNEDHDPVEAVPFVELDPTTTGLDYRHVEDNYDDFNRERLLPQTLSRNGPGIAVADVDGNGLEDVWLGGAMRTSGVIHLQKEPGRFVVDEAINLPFRADSLYEDMGAVFLDADGDGDVDLFVASGGNERDTTDMEMYRPRFYSNDGRGGFTRRNDVLPASVVGSASSVSAADYDGDGDLDLFVAGRCVPGAYPDNPRSFLLRNDKGTFADVTPQVAPSLMRPGMLSTALWTDYDNDGDPDLMAAGEWLSITIYRNDDGKSFTDVTAAAGLDSTNGWWHSLTPGDFDNDGDIDYIAGNMGLNTRSTLQPTPTEPIRLYANDFDGNSSRDLIMTYYYGGFEFPAKGRQALISQMGTYTKRRFPTYNKYSTSKIHQVVDSALMAAADIRYATTFYNAYVENRGDGTFRLHRLPVLAQTSPLMGTVVGDFNGDDHLDLLGMENFYGPDREVIRYDAGYGLYLMGDGKGGFSMTNVERSGFFAPYDGRSMALVDGGADSLLYVVAVNNNNRAQIFKHSTRPTKSRVVTIPSDAPYTHAIISFDDGVKRRHELPIGSGYLTQTSRSIIVTPGMEKITLYIGETEKNVIDLD